jgi:hypothetical protein
MVPFFVPLMIDTYANAYSKIALDRSMTVKEPQPNHWSWKEHAPLQWIADYKVNR